jgi:folate-dependent phosphoribosylglycinamide formyltransferase PurN
MQLTKLHDPENGQMRVVGFMSGSGSNLRKLLEEEARLERERGKSPYRIVGVATDEPNSNALQIANEHGLEFYSHSLEGFYTREGCEDLRNLEVRAKYDEGHANFVRGSGATVTVFAGYMRIATSVLRDAALPINVHPGDLRVVDANGRVYTGDRAVGKAIYKGATKLHAVTHVLTEEVDGGPILMVSNPLAVELPAEYSRERTEAALAFRRQVADAHQDRLKRVGDWEVFPNTLTALADGAYARSEQGILHYKGKPIPNGINIGDL